MTILLLLTLAVASVTDLRSRVIPNWLVAVAAVAGLMVAGYEGRAASALVSGLLASAPFLLVSTLKPEGMGMGDVKLVAVVGICLGQAVWIALAVGLGLAGLTGAVIALGRRQPPGQTALPLAPFLALGAGLTVAVGAGALQ